VKYKHKYVWIINIEFNSIEVMQTCAPGQVKLCLSAALVGMFVLSPRVLGSGGIDF